MKEISRDILTISRICLENKIKKKANIEKTIDDVIEQTSMMLGGSITTLEKDRLKELLMSLYTRERKEPSVCSDNDTPWVKDAKTTINFNLWNRYKQWIREKDPLFPLSDLELITDIILDKCGNPQIKSSWDKRGMVVGNVQSGLINRSIDAGYKVIIVIAGVYSSLRRQTQERCDEGVIGRTTNSFMSKNNIVGVGNYASNNDPEIYSFTTSNYTGVTDDGDFNADRVKGLNIPIGSSPIILVIKKNKSILENIIRFFSDKLDEDKEKLINLPTLIIDDEADNASVNTSRSLDEAKTINRLIRTLINLFDQSTYIGYTATPYANLFIPDSDKELTTRIGDSPYDYKIGPDLFPKDFIINLKAPDNYIGAANFFGLRDPYSDDKENLNEPLDLFRPIVDSDVLYEDKIEKDILPETIPDSLKRAIHSFVLTCAIRRVRGDVKKHNSMLIHISFYINWIDRIAKLVYEYLEDLVNFISGGDFQTISMLRKIYEEDFIPTTQNILDNITYKDYKIKIEEWDNIKKELKNAAAKIDVRAVHGEKTPGNLEYLNIEELDFSKEKNGLSVIAVGGNRLSRGITLEGLSVSYFLRPSKNYDSLMQMGRWFGYRLGYVDLCRLYTTPTIYEWFNHITMATEEMRRDFEVMRGSNVKPKDFQLKVRNHSGLLAITSVSKLYFADELKISFSGTNPQTYQLSKDIKDIKDNFESMKTLLKGLALNLEQQNKNIHENRIIHDKLKYLIFPYASVSLIIKFLESYKINQPSLDTTLLSKYIKKQSDNNQIESWVVCLVSNTDERVFLDRGRGVPRGERKANDKAYSFEVELNRKKYQIGCSIRNQKKNSSMDYYLIPKNQIDTMKDRTVGLSSDKLSYADIKKERCAKKQGLLLIYPLDERGALDVNSNYPIVGFSIHFPIIQNEEKVSYTARVISDIEEEN